MTILKNRIIFLCILSFFSQLTFAGSNVIIINSNNAFTDNSTDTKNTIKRMFLKIMSSWPDGKKVKVIGRGTDSEEYNAFIKEVLGMSNATMAGHWMSLKQKTGETPPRSIKSAKIVIKLVGKKVGAFSFISESEASNLPDNVKILFKY